jgi:hypothetical protein
VEKRSATGDGGLRYPYVHRYTEGRAMAGPQGMEVASATEVLSHRVLNERANGFAGHLVSMVIGGRAILKSRPGYLLLDPASSARTLVSRNLICGER